jgi:hypothetical protein
MDDDMLKQLWALREVNRSLVIGLETALFVMQRWDSLSPERRESMINSLEGLLTQGKEAYRIEPQKH